MKVSINDTTKTFDKKTLKKIENKIKESLRSKNDRNKKRNIGKNN